MRLVRVLPAALMIASLGVVAQEAGTRGAPSAAPEAVTANRTVAPEKEGEFVPEGVVALGAQAGDRAEFRLDHTMLSLASKITREKPEVQRVIAGVNGITVKSFGFPGGVAVDPAVMASIGRAYESAGWLHLVKKHKSETGETTDLWIRMDEATIRDIAVLMVRARRVDFVAASGAVSPVDLLHLSGRFGIPKMDGGVGVPVPGKP